MKPESGNGKRQFGRPDVDVVVVGAGFAGLYLLHRLRGMGFSTKVIESADDVGGTWYWNRYPGARCDILTIDYSYSFDPELETEWQWSERYATQPEILRYLQHVAEKHDLPRDIEFSTRIESAVWDEEELLWRLRIEPGNELTCRFYVMATGCLSQPKEVDVEGVNRFTGATYATSRWPHEGVDFSGMRVAVIGTGSSGIQSIPLIAEQAAELTVFQRTPNFSIPAHNGPLDPKRLAAKAEHDAEYREAARWSFAGVSRKPSAEGALQVSEEERQARYEHAWQAGELIEAISVFNDLLVNPAANETLAEFIRGKIRSIVKDPEVAETLCPVDFPLGTKRLCLDTNYYQTYNLPHVRLVDLRKTPMATITETGIDTNVESFEFDAIVFATGFDAMTGAIAAVDITGRDRVTLKDKWANGPQTYLGLTIAGFPNFFTVTGPGSPSVLSNMAVSIEQHVEWVSDCLEYLRREGLESIEATEAAEAGWVQHVNDYGDITLFPKANSWYMGANVPGKPRVFLPYVGGVDVYRTICEEVVSKDYLGFVLEGPGETRLNDGIIRPVKPDVSLVLQAIEDLGIPPLEEMSVEDARAFAEAMATERPPGPEVGEIADGVLPGASGDLAYRLYRPASPGPHPIVAYFHGGGWVLGSHDSDDPFCRDLCVRSNSIIISADYRHAPEARFPAAPEDGFAAVQWIAENAKSLGGVPGQFAVAGWSAGGNVAAVVCQMARDAGGPDISGQMLVTPVTDCDLSRNSYVENGDGYLLTTGSMHWFWDHYADPSDRQDPKASPLRADDLANLPPALVVTCEFDPLRDEGASYAEAMAAAGVQVRHLPCRGQIHTSVMAVDMVVSGAAARAEMGAALRQFFDESGPASLPVG
jgi:cation diffusion facilitator CzcD-associated flavoprotein CzcO/acetyl esterase/lipase